MNGRGESDSRVVAGKSPNKVRNRAAEGMEPRRLAKRNSSERNMARTQSRSLSMSHALARVRDVARRKEVTKFTALYHHVYNVEHLRAAYAELKPKAAAGVDGVTWAQYGEDVEANLADLSERLRRKAYRAKPVRRVMIPKADGGERPLGVTSLEDKIVQKVATQLLEAVYEPGFKPFSYGFRPGRGPHDALDALTVALKRRKVNWVLDADIRGFFDSLSHEWLVKFVEHRISDRYFVRLIRKWLKAGVLSEGEWAVQDEGTPQGAGISPALANVYLHYVLDEWVQAWRKRQAHGDVIIVRYADDFVMGFEHRTDAERLQKELAERLKRFDLELNPRKTRLIEFGRHAARNRKERAEGKPETFDFLGFTHISGKTRRGAFQVWRRTMRKKMRAKVASLKLELRRRMHEPIPEVGRWLGKVLGGHYRYYGVHLNTQALHSFRDRLTRLWYNTLRRRSQTGRVRWERMRALIQRWLPIPKVYHPWPELRYGVVT